MSASFISQVENEKARPRIETLHRIAAVLGTTAQAILSDAAGGARSLGPGGAVVSRASGGGVVQQSDDPADGAVRSLIGGHSDFHAMEIRGAPLDFGAPYEHPGNELLYVIDGRVQIEVGDEVHDLGPGDSIGYSGDVPHRTRRVDGDVRLLIVTSHTN